MKKNFNVEGTEYTVEDITAIATCAGQYSVFQLDRRNRRGPWANAPPSFCRPWPKNLSPVPLDRSFTCGTLSPR